MSSETKNKLRKLFSNVNYLIIDEISMIGNTLLNQISARLNDIFGVEGKHTHFGGLNVIFCGDLYQIPPVHQTMVYEPKGVAALGINLWKDLVSFSELTEVIRSKNDSIFTKMCHRVRIGKHTLEDIKLLASRVVTKIPTIAESMDKFFIFPTNKQVDQHNAACIAHLENTQKVHDIHAIDSFANPVLAKSGKNISSYIPNVITQTAGLPTLLRVGIGAKVMIRRNISTANKLVNGMTGIVTYIHYSSASPIPTVYIKCADESVGIKIKHDCQKSCKSTCQLHGSIPIKPVEFRFLANNRKTFIKRYQLPLTLSWALTMHKVQGMTLDCAYIFLGTLSDRHTLDAGMAYTAISRLTSLQGLFFLKFDPKEIRTSISVENEYKRLRSLPKVNYTFQNIHNGNTDTYQLPAGNGQNILSQNYDPVSVITATSPSTASVPNFNSLFNHHIHLTSPPVSPHLSTCNAVPTVNHVSTPKHSTSGVMQQTSTPPFKKQKLLDSNIDFNLGATISSPSHNYIGYARIIDFMNSPCAGQLNEHFKALGFNVNPVLTHDQQDVSCGYNSARVASKLAYFEQNWFNIHVNDCYYNLYSNTLQKELVSQGNSILDIRYSSPSHDKFGQIMDEPIYLTDMQCTTLFHFYSNLYFNKNYTNPADRSRFAYVGIGHTQYTNSILKHYYDSAIETGIGCPLNVTFVNTSNNSGSHWFISAFQIFDKPSSNEL